MTVAPSTPDPSETAGRWADVATHRCFGLDWAMPLPFPLFAPVHAPSGCDVRVRFGTAPPLGAGANAAGPLRQSASRRTRFNVPQIGNFLIEAGNAITIERLSVASEQSLQLFLIGTASALILHQRGFLPLHASGIHTDKGAVLFTGHSGAGKSTTLAAMLARGYPMICDDLAAIRIDTDGIAWVEPGVKYSKLWADSAHALGVDTATTPRVRPEMQKFVIDRSASAVVAPVRLHAIYQIGTHNRPDWNVEVIPPAERFNVVLDHTWQKMTVKRMGLHVAHFQLASVLAAKVQIRRFRRPDHREFDLQRLVTTLEADFLA